MKLSRFEQDLLNKTKIKQTKGDSRWSELKDIAVVSYSCFMTRISRDNLDPYEAATTPLKKVFGEYYWIDGIEGTRKEHCDRLGIKPKTVSCDMSRHGLTFEEAIDRRKSKKSN